MKRHGRNRLTIRYGIRWDGRGRPKPTRMVALGFALIALLLPASARAADAGDAAATASLQRIAGGAGIAAGAPDGSGVDVALIDSGVVPIGPLAGRIVHGPDFSAERRDRRLATLDTFGHGTHVAGVIAQTAPGARIVSLKVAEADGTTSLAQVLAAMEWVRRNKDANGLRIRVVNLSLGVQDEGGYRNDILAWAVEQLWKEGITVVAAAGNNGKYGNRLDIPAADPFVIAVGATDTFGTVDPADDRVADFSSRSRYRSPDVVAPGSSIVSLRVPGSALDLEYPEARVGAGHFRGSGTSQAAGVVTGLAARLLSVRPMSPDQLKSVLKDGAVDLPDPVEADGAGRVDLTRSLAVRVPLPHEAKQDWLPAILDPRVLAAVLFDRHEYGPGEEAEWAGRRWSGRRWSGRRWSGRRWSGASWIDASAS